MAKQPPPPPIAAPWSTTHRPPLPAPPASEPAPAPAEADRGVPAYEQAQPVGSAVAAGEMDPVAAALAAVEQAHAALSAAAGRRQAPLAPLRVAVPDAAQNQPSPPQRPSPLSGIGDRIARYRQTHSMMAIAGLGLAGVVLVGFAGTAVATAFSSHPTPPAHAATPAVVPPASWCPDGAGPAMIGTAAGTAASTAEAGDPGIGAIADFYRGYYQQRSGTAARQAVAPGANVPAADKIDAGIAQAIPAGTTYCAAVNPSADSTYDVTLKWRVPDGRISSDEQIVTTATAAGKTLITAITKKK